MRKLLAAAALLTAASATTIAVAQIKPLKPDGSYDVAVAQEQMPQAEPMTAPAGETTDAQSVASVQEVAEARRAYRAACNQHESPGFCECVTAGVAQALLPSEVRMAARTIGERITAQGDAAIAADSDDTTGAESSAERIEQVEGHYADACARLRA